MHQPSILVIDDEPDNFETIEALLYDRGYQLHYASSGQEALNSLPIFQPDIILLDVMMPGLDGITVCQRIKALTLWQTVPIVIVTALTGQKDLARCLEAGADDFLSKPVNGIELRARVHSMLRIKHHYLELERQVEARTAALKTKAEREQLIAKIAAHIRSSLNLQEILNTTVQEVRSLLNCDRAAIWQFQPDWSTKIVAEAISNGLVSFLGEQGYDPCLTKEWIELYCQGQVRVVPDVCTTAISDCHRQLLEQFQVRSKISVPIIQGDQLWGLLSVFESQTLRPWQPEETALLQQLATHLAIAIQQAMAYHQVQLELAERQRTEANLRQSEQRYASLAAAAPVGIFRANLAGNCLYVNERWCEMSGLTPKEAVGTGWIQGLYPPDQEAISSAWCRTIRDNDPFRLEYRFQKPDGTITWVFGQTVAERDIEGRIIGYIGTITDITDRKQAEEQLRHNALYDALTDLPNRNLLMERLTLAIHQAKQQKDYAFAVLFLDLDGFKVINDSLGHLAGDRLLTNIAQQLQSNIRKTDLAARLGGDEFVILLEEIAGIQDAISVAEKIFAKFQSPFKLNDREIFITTSIGIVLGNSDYSQASDLLRDADIAMYRAKAQGRNSYKIFDTQMHAQAIQRLNRESDLRHALERDELRVYYQPIFALERPHLVGFEALVRWQHPTLGLVFPGDFIPLAEETGMIVQLDHWMLHSACQQLSLWHTRFPHVASLKVSVNLSDQDLRQSNFLDNVDRILAETGLDCRTLNLEITESVLIENILKTIDLLFQLKARKIQLSIDDFGTGYSSLNYLHRLPADTLKIDRSFVSQMHESSRNYQIVKTIITLSQELGLQVIAEGIETQQQVDWLQMLGCQFGQGYLFSKPLPPDAIETMLVEDSVLVH